MTDQPASGPENITCPSCGTVQLPGPFCTNCGALLSTPAAGGPPPEGAPSPSPPPYGGAAPTPPPPPIGPSGGVPFGGQPPKPPYPVSLEFSGPEQLSRLSTFFRLILAIPLFIFLAVIGGTGSGILVGLVVAHWLSLLVRKGRPVGWIGSTIVAILRFYFRAYAYLLLLTDKYPAFEGEWFLSLEMDRPERLSRRQIFVWKTLALIPHFICLMILWFAVAVCEVIGWFAILFTGRFPRGLRDFVVGYMRWGARVTAYWISLRDDFPPYSLAADGAAGSKRATGFSALGGVVAAVAIGVGGTFAYIAVTEPETAHVSYASLTSGRSSPSLVVDNVHVHLTNADDDYDFPGDLLVPDDDSRLVMIEASLFNNRVYDLDIFRLNFELREDDGDKNDPAFISIGGVPSPATLESGDFTLVLLVFEVDEDADPAEFRYGPEGGLRDAKFIFD